MQKQVETKWLPPSRPRITTLTHATTYMRQTRRQARIQEAKESSKSEKTCYNDYLIELNKKKELSDEDLELYFDSTNLDTPAPDQRRVFLAKEE